MQTEKTTKTEELWAGVRQYCRSQALFGQGDRVIAAVSGGADSMALLLFLLANRGEWDLTVEAVHVNHGLRGAAAEADEAFVAEFCQRNGVPLYIYRLAEEEDIPEQAGEDWARQARYRRFEALAREKRAKIATAHTLNDQAETLLFRLARGAGVKGAGAIPPKRGPFVRPFLGLRREATEYLCRQAGVEYCTDETNDTDQYARNLLRHKALPAMTQANSGALEAMARFCEQMRQMDSYLNARGEKLLRRAALGETPEEAPEWAGGRYCAKSLRIAPAPERAAALRLLVGPAFEPEARHIALMEEALLEGGAVQLGPRLRFVVKNGEARLEKAEGERPLPLPPQPFLPGEYALAGGYHLKAEVLEGENLEKFLAVWKKDLNYLADYDKILQVGSVLRTRREKDSFCPAGRGVTKTLKKWYNEWKIPLPARALLPLLAEENRVLWLWGKGFAQGLGPEKDTRRLLVMHTREDAEENENA